jgi:prepilin-type N-terminal cleavage/methylation domain-containing protein
LFLSGLNTLALRRCKAQSPRQARGRTSGFSLVELAIALAVIGLVLGTTLTLYQGYIRTKAENDTETRQELIRIAIARFVATNGRLPCPARPNLATTNASSGVEQCTPVGGATGVTATAGFRGMGQVLVGSLPFASLNMSIVDGYDGWGSSFTYAVTQSLTDAGTFNESNGGIRLVSFDAAGAATTLANPRVVTSNGAQQDSFMFAVVSHGPDKKGSFTVAGIAQTACTGTARDVQNCNRTATFAISPRNYIGTGANFYDDAFVMTDYVETSDLWYQPGMGRNAGAMRPALVPDIPADGRVVLGIPAARGAPDDPLPPQRLWTDSSIQVQELHATRVCDAASGNCIAAPFIGGSAVDCGSGLLLGIVNGKAVCTDYVRESGVTTGTCPGGAHLKGYCPSGLIWCSNTADPCP